MISPFAWIVVLGSVVWMGIDASQRDFSSNKFARSTVQWVIGGLCLWIVTFPVYLVLRRRTPRKDKLVATSAGAWLPPAALATASVPFPSTSVPPPSMRPAGRCASCAGELPAGAPRCPSCGLS